ncbi:MAG: flagellar basal body rod protein FlgF [Betaproteobacteria bacterium]|nr:flagellar basal body rod protein FlgF [Betaproteobacteria bacterium]NBT05217.1 flagellar basal body rod protein FlgF [Betaproteobacteria bacterium]NDE53004.1 flagellar basal body rod protein FlgF [Actinomycetota bacterium]
MDRMIFAAMTGARAAVGQLAVTANNLANASTPGFKEQIAAFRAVPMGGDGANTRAFVLDTTPGSYFAGGRIESTASPLDIAIQDKGFIVVQRPDGSQALTRNGRLSVDSQGVLRGALGYPIVGQGGNIVLPANSQPDIADDGTVSVIDSVSRQPQIIGRIRLVNPAPSTLERAGDGLFSAKDASINADPEVRVVQGFLEGSNVNVASAMVAMVSQQRLFDMNMKSIQNADLNARSANGIMSLSRS